MAVSRYDKDSAIFLLYGLDADFRASLVDKVAAVRNFPSDPEQKGNAMDFNEQKLANSDVVILGIRTMMVKVKQVFKEGSSNFVKFGTNDLHKMDDLKLIKCGFRVVRRATEFLPQLIDKGVTQQVIDQLEADVKLLDKNYDDQQDAILERKATTIETHRTSQRTLCPHHRTLQLR